MKISMLQMNVKPNDPRENFAHAKAMVRQAARGGADVITLPETWTTGFAPDEHIGDYADQDCAQVRRTFSALSRELRVNIIAGSVVNRKLDGFLYNTACVFDREGNLIAQYDKVHLYSPSGEDKTFRAGNSPCNFTLDGVPCSLVICYDIRFPELFRTEMLRGSLVQFLVAQWTEEKVLVWDTMNRSRAIENLCWLSCTSPGGIIDGVQYSGHSAVYGPLGECLVLGGREEEIVTAEVDVSHILKVRKAMDIYRDRRPDVYDL